MLPLIIIPHSYPPLLSLIIVLHYFPSFLSLIIIHPLKPSKTRYNVTIDYWGLGVLLYEACTGNKVFAKEKEVLEHSLQTFGGRGVVQTGQFPFMVRLLPQHKGPFVKGRFCEGVVLLLEVLWRCELFLFFREMGFFSGRRELESTFLNLEFQYNSNMKYNSNSNMKKRHYPIFISFQLWKKDKPFHLPTWKKTHSRISWTLIPVTELHLPNMFSTHSVNAMVTPISSTSI